MGNVAKSESPKDIVGKVLNQIEVLQGSGEILLPKNYNVENALKSVQLHLNDVKDKNGKPVLESCTTVSIANSLLKMVVQGLSVAKNQCYFIAYGDQLTFSRSYNGSIALAKRVAGVKKVVPVVIYEGDEFEFGVDIDTGVRRVTKHNTSFKNIDNSKIIGAYAVVHFENGDKVTEIMTIAEIEAAWNQGQMKGGSPAHKNFRQEMCKKTVINRACKEPIATSDDSHLYMEEDYIPTVKETVSREIESNANDEEISFDIIDDKKEIVEAVEMDFPTE